MIVKNITGESREKYEVDTVLEISLKCSKSDLQDMIMDIVDVNADNTVFRFYKTDDLVLELRRALESVK